MDFGGLNVAVMLVGALALGLALLFAVMKTKSRGRQDNDPAVDRETRARYAEEERNKKNHES